MFRTIRGKLQRLIVKSTHHPPSPQERGSLFPLWERTGRGGAFTVFAGRRSGGGISFLSLGCLQELRELLNTDAILGIGAPFDTGRADRPGVQMTALLAGGLRLVAPDLDLLAALLAPDVFRLWRPYLNASWTTFFKHDPTLHPLRQRSYDLNHMPASGPASD